LKPPRFAYHRPGTKEEVDALLSEHGDEAKILAGGQSLVPILNMRLASPAHLIDINRLEDSATAPEVDGDAVVFDAAVRQSAAARSKEVAELVPLLAETIEFVAHPAIRNRGTVAGSIAHADPAAELPAALAVLEGEVVARRAGGKRRIAAAEFFAGPLENSLEATEWVESVRWPVRRPECGYAFEEFARRSGDFALCGVAAAAARHDGKVSIALCYLGLGDVPARVEAGPLAPDDLGDALDDAVGEAAAVLEAADDIHATARYRRFLAHRLGTKATRRAWRSIEEPE
jgi:aerobic carbon-monoxide dehydrogenase medium subunit